MAMSGRDAVDKEHRNVLSDDKKGPDNILDGNDAHDARQVTSSAIVRPPARIEDLPIQPNRPGAWLERNPPHHIRELIQQIKGPRVNDREATEAGGPSSLNIERRIRNVMHTTEPLDPILPWPQRDPSSGAGKTPFFKAGLGHWGLGPSKNTEIYDYYRELDRMDVIDSEPASTASILREVLEEDANARLENARIIRRWTRKNEIGRGGYARVALVSLVLLRLYEDETHASKWEKQASDGGPLLRMAVKDSVTSKFWRDYYMEGTLVRKLNEVGCKNVITIFDWLWKPAWHSQDELVRACYEGTLKFYKKHNLLIPEAFVWHVFWSLANALCHCRHGTNQSANTRPGWDTIIHGDIKPANLFLTTADMKTNGLYPTVKLGDFGVAYSMPESNNKLRAWKSTFNYGTPCYMAPEVRDLDPDAFGQFRPISPDSLHGSHTVGNTKYPMRFLLLTEANQDVWSLGAVIEELLELRYNAVKDNTDINIQYIEGYYSTELQRLVNACKSRSIHIRPPIYDVYLRTLEGRDKYKRIAVTEVKEVSKTRQPYHSEVLYRREDRLRFYRDRTYRTAYMKVNRQPLLTGEKTPDPKESVPQSIAPGNQMQAVSSAKPAPTEGTPQSTPSNKQFHPNPKTTPPPSAKNAPDSSPSRRRSGALASRSLDSVPSKSQGVRQSSIPDPPKASAAKPLYATFHQDPPSANSSPAPPPRSSPPKRKLSRFTEDLPDLALLRNAPAAKKTSLEAKPPTKPARRSRFEEDLPDKALFRGAVTKGKVQQEQQIMSLRRSSRIAEKEARVKKETEMETEKGKKKEGRKVRFAVSGVEDGGTGEVEDKKGDKGKGKRRAKRRG
ncbi:MAG: hypothetical protein Q9181_003330 [Wetmoreana brouardii]